MVVIALGGSAVSVQFSGRVGVLASIAASNFTINTIFTVTGTPTQINATTIGLTMSGTILAGYTFALTGQPSWVDTDVVFPESGSVTA